MNKISIRMHVHVRKLIEDENILIYGIVLFIIKCDVSCQNQASGANSFFFFGIGSSFKNYLVMYDM